MATTAELLRTPDKPRPIPVSEQEAKRKIYKRIWDAKSESMKPGWINLLRINHDTGEGYIYPDPKDEKGHPGYSFDKDKLVEIWSNQVSMWKIVLSEGYPAMSASQDFTQSDEVFIYPTLALPGESHLVFKRVSEVYSIDTTFILQRKSPVESDEWMVQRLNPRKWKNKSYT